MLEVRKPVGGGGVRIGGTNARLGLLPVVYHFVVTGLDLRPGFAIAPARFLWACDGRGVVHRNGTLGLTPRVGRADIDANAGGVGWAIARPLSLWQRGEDISVPLLLQLL